MLSILGVFWDTARNALEEDGGEARVAVGGELLLALSDQALLRVRVRVRG